MKLTITDHAVARFRERWAPALAAEEALAELERELRGAALLPSKGDRGADVYLLPSGARIVVEPNRKARGEFVLVTVLPRGSRVGNAVPQRRRSA